MQETAYAKINLALHVRNRRADGYHELETLFAFVDDGDRLDVTPAAQDELRCFGEFSSELTDPFDNIISKALAALPHDKGWSVNLEKRLPVAAGLGGGSADAGAVFRLIERSHGLPADWQASAASLGADVPACVASQTCLGHGTGTDLSPVENDLTGTAVLLVNPRQPLATGPVFKGWGSLDHGPLPQGTARHIALNGRNDLEQSAIAICPPIAAVLNALSQTGGFLTRMSGSGATCFTLYERHDVMLEAAEKLVFDHPQWWFMPGRLR
jgi:4-diphosphocytidyl-2-C-methyl-D-erythritol kinase